jgi:hypothetical protein
MIFARSWATGDSLLTKDWKPKINNRNGLKAIKMLKQVVDEYASPGVFGYSGPTYANEFIKGNDAVYENWLQYIMPGLNDDKSNQMVEGKWDVGVSRESVLKDLDVLGKFPWYEGYVNLSNAGKPIPPVPYWLEMFMAIGTNVGSYLSGEIKDPQKTLDNIAEKWVQLIDENPMPDFDDVE